MARDHEQGKEIRVTYSVGELIEMARAVSEGDFEREFRQHFQGELGQLVLYIETLRHNLKSISSTADSSACMLPEAANGIAEISQQAELGVNSNLELVEEMLADQEQVEDFLDSSAHNGTKTPDLAQLKEIARKSRRRLMSLMSYLSFQDVIRQRAEKVQGVIEDLEKKTLKLLVKFRVKINEQVIRDGDGWELLR